MRARTTLVAVMAVALLAAACGGGGTGGVSSGAGARGPDPARSGAGDFGSLAQVCHGGSASHPTDTGVTATAIDVGVFSDVGFTKNPEVQNAAKAFTSWCNAAGGINGRKLVPHLRDTRIFRVRQQVATSCTHDFAMVGGSSALDADGTPDRLRCLLPAFPNQVDEAANRGSGLQVDISGFSPSYNMYAGEYQWLLKQAYPDSRNAVGIIAGDSPITRVLGAEAKEGLRATGARIVYDDLSPIAGPADWAPYAQKIKDRGVKGLIFYGDYTQLVKLEAVLTTMDIHPDWIDANPNAYSDTFIKLVGSSAVTQNNILDLSGLFPVERAGDNPSTQQVVDLFAKYEPGEPVTGPALRAFSAWLLFAKSATACGDALTRKCVYTTATTEAAWTGGGLQAPVNLTTPDLPPSCFNIEQATSSGWRPADFIPNQIAYRCGQPAYRLRGNYPRPVTLASVGKSLKDLN